MNKIDSLIAPRALTATEIAQVTVNQMISYGVAKRAFIFAHVLQDDADVEVATVHASETALEAIVEDAVRSLGEWLADMEGDKEPRFYRKASLKDAVRSLFQSAAELFLAQSADAGVAVIVSQLTDRDEATLQAVIDKAD